MNDPNYLQRSNSLTVRLTRRISNLFRFSSFRKPNPSTKTRTTFYDNDKPVDMTRFSFSSIDSTDISNAFMKYEKNDRIPGPRNSPFGNDVTEKYRKVAREHGLGEPTRVFGRLRNPFSKNGMAVEGKKLRKKDVVAVDEVLRVLDSNDETALIKLREKLHQSKNQNNNNLVRRKSIYEKTFEVTETDLKLAQHKQKLARAISVYDPTPLRLPLSRTKSFSTEKKSIINFFDDVKQEKEKSSSSSSETLVMENSQFVYRKTPPPPPMRRKTVDMDIGDARLENAFPTPSISPTP